MRDWQNDAPKMIAAIHTKLPDGSTPDDLRKALRKEAWHFHCGTSWGKRVWSKHCRRYLAQLTGNGAQRNDGKTFQWPDDIAFPFKRNQ